MAASKAGRGADRRGRRRVENALPKDVRLLPVPERIDWDEALRLHGEGWTYSEIAERCGYQYSTVANKLRARGAKRRRRHERRTERHGIRLYHLWCHLRGRCEDPRHRDYAQYGGRGIRFARAWSEFDAFYDWAVAAGYRPGLVLDRLRSNGPFTPGNSRWVPAATLHKKRRARQAEPSYWIHAFGERKGPAQWARDPRCRVSLRSLGERIHAGWPPEEAISSPVGSQPSRRVTPPASSLHRKRPARIPWEEARRLYEEEGLDEGQIARRFDAHRGSIVKGLARSGVERRPRREAVATADPETNRLYQFWVSLHERCENPGYHLYSSNGARGARVARVWREFTPFLEWARATGARPGLVLARLDTNRNFSPSNCAWQTPLEARRFTKRPRKPFPVRLITAFGETRGITEWSHDPRCQVTATTLHQRLRRGLTPEEAIGLPPENRGKRDHPTTELKAFGSVKCFADWARDPRCKVSPWTLRDRLRRGWTPEAALSTPRFARPRAHGPARSPRRR